MHMSHARPAKQTKIQQDEKEKKKLAARIKKYTLIYRLLVYEHPTKHQPTFDSKINRGKVQVKTHKTLERKKKEKKVGMKEKQKKL